MTEPKKMMDIKEFTNIGYLQEVNRKFFHPLGLAMVVEEKENGEMVLLGIWDKRDDPIGIIFNHLNMDKLDRVEKLIQERLPEREREMGYFVQRWDADENDKAAKDV